MPLEPHFQTLLRSITRNILTDDDVISRLSLSYSVYEYPLYFLADNVLDISPSSNIASLPKRSRTDCKEEVIRGEGGGLWRLFGLMEGEENVGWIIRGPIRFNGPRMTSLPPYRILKASLIPFLFSSLLAGISAAGALTYYYAFIP